MHANSHHFSSKLLSTLFAAMFLLTIGPAALRTVAEWNALLARVSLQLCEIGIAVLRVCGI
jgi:hypothetical protein